MWRALQGFIGGGMIPTVFASAFTIFPPSKRTIVSPMIGLVATLAPTIGPTVGGYLTDLMSWHWLFLVNVVPGILVTISTAVLVDFDKPNMALLDSFDWFGPRRDGGLPRLPRIRARRGPEPRLAAGRGGVRLCHRLRGERAAVLLAGLHRPDPHRGPARLLRPQLRERLRRELHHGYRTLWADLPLSRLPRAGPGLFGPHDRRDDVRLRPVHVHHRAIAGRFSGKIDPRILMAVGFGGFAVGTYIVTASPRIGISGSCSGRRSCAAAR